MCVGKDSHKRGCVSLPAGGSQEAGFTQPRVHCIYLAQLIVRTIAWMKHFSEIDIPLLSLAHPVAAFIIK